MERKIKFYIGKSERLRTQENKNSPMGPQTYHFKDESLNRLSKFPGVQCMRIKT